MEDHTLCQDGGQSMKPIVDLAGFSRLPAHLLILTAKTPKMPAARQDFFEADEM